MPMRIVRFSWQGFGAASLAAWVCGGFSRQEFMDSPKSILEKPGAQLEGACNILDYRYGGFLKIWVPQNEWFVMESPTEIDDLGVPPF